MTIEVERIKSILDAAASEKRFQLLEHEVYQVLGAAGCAVPRFHLLAPGAAPDPDALRALGSERVVVKIVSPEIAHKTDVGGVVKVEASAAAVAEAARKMLQEVPQRYARSLEARPGHAPKCYRGLMGKASRTPSWPTSAVCSWWRCSASKAKARATRSWSACSTTASSATC
ncbi:MAG TPA: acetate--CoA ligase family protein [Polyangiaceae bacterium]|nr:acetate--CoA ligase family protein [Polyangiaceae bacterium]